MDNEEVVVLGDTACAAMRAGAGFLVAAAAAAATAGRTESMSSGRGLGAGGCRGPVVTWRPAGPIWSAAVDGGGEGLRSPAAGSDWAGLLRYVRVCGLASVGGNNSHGVHSRAGGVWSGFAGACVGGVCGSPGGVGVPWGAGLCAAGVCGSSGAAGGEGCRSGGPVIGMCGCSGA